MRLCTTLSALAAAAVVFVPASRADEKADAASAARKAKREQDLAKYDVNKDGKINANEREVMKADQEKEKELKKKKKEEDKKTK